MATIKNKQQFKGWQRDGEMGNLVHYWWKCKNGAVTRENSMSVPQKFKKRTTCSSSSTSGYTPERIESRVSKGYLYMRVHNCIIHNSQKVKATQMSIHGWISKIWYIHKMGFKKS